MENVTECHKRENFKGFSEWLGFLRSLGYQNFYYDMDAKKYGIPQSRNRCFMVSILGSNNEYYFPQETGLFHVVQEYLEDNVSEDHYVKDETAKELLDNLEDDVVVVDDTYGFGEDKPRTYSYICPTLRAAHADLKCVVCAMRGRPIDNPSSRESGQPTKQRLEPNLSGSTNAITTVQKDNLLIVYDDYNSNVRKDQSTVGTITTTIGNSAIRNGQKLIDKKHKRLRKFTTKETWRLFGFQDKDIEAAEKVTAKTALYNQAGNSICVNCLIAVFGQLFSGKENYYKEFAKRLNFDCYEPLGVRYEQD